MTVHKLRLKFDFWGEIPASDLSHNDKLWRVVFCWLTTTLSLSAQQVVGRDAIRIDVREDSIPVLWRTYVQGQVQHIGGEAKGSDGIVQYADPKNRRRVRILKLYFKCVFDVWYYNLYNMPKKSVMNLYEIQDVLNGIMFWITAKILIGFVLKIVSKAWPY